MIEFEAQAIEKIVELLESDERRGKAMRVEIRGRGPNGFEYSLRFIDPDEGEESDISFDAGGFLVRVDADSAGKLEGARVEYVQNAYQSGFNVVNPNPLFEDPIAQSVQEIIETRINPGVAAHGGYVLLHDVRDNIAYIELGGGCQGCGLADVTLKQGIDVMIKEAVPQIREVLDTTNHAAGTNPYYQPAKGDPGGGGQSPFA